MLESIRHFIDTLSLNFRAADLLDIALIAGLLYALLAWMRDRVSKVVGFGVVLVAVVYGLARLLDLYLTLMVFQVGLVAVVVSLVVVFQKDIRRLFEQLRVMNPWEGGLRTHYQAQMEVLVDAVEQMAARHMGALIVLPGREALDVHLSGGVDAYAEISVPMLLSIFDPQSAGHDGAVIIEEGRIAQFGVHLPLSDRHEKIGPGGTRHAAALGLAERTDALVIVVSEERGVISVGREHELEVLASAAELGPMIAAFHQAERREAGVARRLPHWVTHNMWLKLLALALAAGLWGLFAYRVENVQRTYEVPIEYRGLNPQWALQDPKPIGARVELTGSERAFNALDPRSLTLSVDSSNLSEGAQRIALSDEQLDVPAGMTVTDIIPSTVTLTAYKMSTQKLPVSAQLQGEVAPGFEVRRVVTEPGRVEVQLPEHMADGIKELPTEPISIAGLTQDKTVKARLLPGKNIRFSGDTPPEIKVQIEVAARPPDAPPR